MITIREFYKRLEQFDWFYAMSDDYRVYHGGMMERKRIAHIAYEGGDNYLRLFRDYQKHVYTGRPWGTEKAPKPEVEDYECEHEG